MILSRSQISTLIIIFFISIIQGYCQCPYGPHKHLQIYQGIGNECQNYYHSTIEPIHIKEADFEILLKKNNTQFDWFSSTTILANDTDKEDFGNYSESDDSKFKKGTKIACIEYPGIIKIKDHTKTGYVNKKGEIVIPAIYDSIIENPSRALSYPNRIAVYDTIIANKVMPAQKNGKWGIIDRKGKEVVPFIYEDMLLRIIPSGINFNLIYVVLNNKIGFLDDNGKQVIPCMYDVKTIERALYEYPTSNEYYSFFYHKNCGNCGIECESGALVSLNGKTGVVNENLKELIPCKYDSIQGIGRNGDGNYRGETYYFKVYLGDKCGVLDFCGKIVVPVIYDKIYMNINMPIPDNLFVAVKENKFGIFDSKGKEILPCKYEDVSYMPYDKYNSEKPKINYDRVNQVLNYNGVVHYGPGWHERNLFIPVKENKFGMFYHDTTNERFPFSTEIPVPFIYVCPNNKPIVIYPNPNFILKSNGKYGIIDIQGKIVSPFIGDYIEPIQPYFSFKLWAKMDSIQKKENYYIINKGGKWGIINAKGKEIIPCVYSSKQHLLIFLNAEKYESAEFYQKLLPLRDNLLSVLKKQNNTEDTIFINRRYIIQGPKNKPEGNWIIYNDEGEKAFDIEYKNTNDIRLLNQYLSKSEIGTDIDFIQNRGDSGPKIESADLNIGCAKKGNKIEKCINCRFCEYHLKNGNGKLQVQISQLAMACDIRIFILAEGEIFYQNGVIQDIKIKLTDDGSIDPSLLRTMIIESQNNFFKELLFLE